MAVQSGYPRGEALVECLYDCVTEPDGWAPVVDALRQAVGGRVGVIGVIDAASRETRLSVAAGEEALVGPLIGEYRLDNPFLTAPPHLEFDVPYTVDNIYDVLGPGTQGRWLSARVTQEFVIPNELDDFFWLTLMKQPTRTGSLAILTGRDKAISAGDLAWMQTMAPHVRRAVTIGDLFEAERAAAAAFRSLVEALAHPVLIVAPDMRVMFANAAAEALLNEGVVVRLAAGRLALPFSHAERALAAAVELGRRDEFALGAAGINVPLVSAAVPAVAHVLPLVRREEGARFARAAAAAIFIALPGAGPMHAIEAIAALFGLTSAERRIAVQVAEGRSRKDIALAQGVSDGTVKTQLAAIFDKTGVHDQRHLELLIRELTPPVKASS